MEPLRLKDDVYRLLIIETFELRSFSSIKYILELHAEIHSLVSTFSSVEFGSFSTLILQALFDRAEEQAER